MAIDSNTLVLLHLDGNVKDECGHTFTSSNTTFDSSNKKMGVSSAHVSDGGKILCTSPGFDIGGADFTIDFWVRLERMSTYSRVYNVCRNKSWIELMSNNGAANGTYSVRGYGDSPTTPSWAITNLDLSKWTHYAYVYQHNIKKRTLYIDGKSVLTATQEIPRDTVKSIELMNNTAAEANYSSVGWIDEFRISSCARWISNFTPPTAPYGSEDEGGARSNEL